jgi:hypothetical protein
MCERWDSLIEISGAQTPKAEITQESPQGGDQLLSGFGPAVAGSVEHEFSYLHRLPTGGVLTQGVGQSGSATGILAQGGFSHTTVLSEPIAKRDDQFGFGPVSIRTAVGLANPCSDQVAVKPFRPEACMVVFSSAVERRAVTAGQVAIEGIQRTRTDRSEGAAPALQETAEMGCRAQVSYGSQWRVAIPFESLSKSVDVRTTGTRTQTSQGFGCREVLFQHGVLLVMGQKWPHTVNQRTSIFMGS